MLARSCAEFTPTSQKLAFLQRTKIGFRALAVAHRPHTLVPRHRNVGLTYSIHACTSCTPRTRHYTHTCCLHQWLWQPIRYRGRAGNRPQRGRVLFMRSAAWPRPTGRGGQPQRHVLKPHERAESANASLPGPVLARCAGVVQRVRGAWQRCGRVSAAHRFSHVHAASRRAASPWCPCQPCCRMPASEHAQQTSRAPRLPQ